MSLQIKTRHMLLFDKDFVIFFGIPSMALICIHYLFFKLLINYCYQLHMDPRGTYCCRHQSPVGSAAILTFSYKHCENFFFFFKCDKIFEFLIVKLIKN